MSKSLIFFIILLLFSLFLYTFRLSAIPVNVHGDEAETALQALRIHYDFTVLSNVGWYDLSLLSFLPHKITMGIFGETVAGNRLAAVLFGVLTLPFYFLLAKNLFSKRIAFLALIFLSTSHLFIALSRIGTIYSQAAFISVVTYYLLFKAFRTDALLYYALAGISAGLTLYTYYAARVVIVIALFCMICNIFTTQRRTLKTKGIGFFLLCLILTSLPISITFFSNPSAFFSRSQEVFLFSPQNSDWLQSVYHTVDPLSIVIKQTQTVLMLSFDASDQYGFKSTLIDYVTLALLIIGFLLLLKKMTLVKFFVLIWFITTVIIGQILTVPPLFVPRFVVGLPALFLICAIGLDWLLTRLETINRNISYGFVISLMICIIGINIFNYFYISEKMIDPNANSVTKIGEYLRKLPRETHAYFLTEPFFYKNYSTIEFLSPHIPKHDIEIATNSAAKILGVNTKKSVFVIHPAYADKYNTLVKQFPSGISDTIYDDSGNVVLFLYTLH